MKKLFSVVALLAGAGLATVICSLTEVALARKMWGWFLSEEYGPPPSTKALFAIFTFFSFMVLTCLTNVKKVDPDKDINVFIHLIGTTLGLLVGCLTLAGITYLTGTLMGWL